MKLPEPGHYEPCPAGTHLATCYEVIDFGSHAFQEGDPRKPQIWIGWELCEEVMDDGRPWVIGRQYTLSSFETAKLRTHLEAWRGSPFKDEDFGPQGKFDIRNLIGASCLINVEHVVNAKGVTKAKPAAVMVPQKGTPRKIKPTNPQVYFSLDPAEFDVATYDGLPEWMQDKIAKSPEWAALRAPAGAVDDEPESVEVDVPF